MAGTSFSLTEKLAVTGAFLALVALMVGTEDDPGLVITSQDTVKDLRVAAPAAMPANAPAPPPAPAPQPAMIQPAAAPEPVPSALAQPQSVEVQSNTPAQSNSDDEDGKFSPELGRVPLDFSKGPPPG